MTTSIGKTFEFAAAHRLYRESWSDEKNHAVFGKCANKNGHGHNYRLEVYVSGSKNDETGMIFDAQKLGSLIKTHILDEVDHKNLDQDVPWLEGKITTVENLVELFWERLDHTLQKEYPNHFLSELKLWETGRISAVKKRA